jgi:hypothetical protein
MRLEALNEAPEKEAHRVVHIGGSENLKQV